MTQILQSRTEEAAKSADVGITTYLYAGNRLLAEDGAEYLTYHFNNVGSTTAVTDKSGNIKYRYAYSVYGELLKGKYGEVLFLYNGQYGVQSDDSGLYYMRARYYNAAIKRFINQDTVTGSIESSQSLNRYAYVEGNPVSYLDPFGLCPEDRIDTTDLHKAISILTIMAITTTAVVIASSSGTATVTALSTFNMVSNILSSIDTLAYLYDFRTARNDEEKMAAIVGMGVNAMGFSVNNAIDILTNITSVFTEQELKIAHIVISYDCSSATTAVSNFINGLEY